MILLLVWKGEPWEVSNISSKIVIASKLLYKSNELSSAIIVKPTYIKILTLSFQPYLLPVVGRLPLSITVSSLAHLNSGRWTPLSFCFFLVFRH